MKALGQGSAKYGQDIEDKLKQIEKNANDIQIEAGLCLHNMVAMTHNGTERNGKAIEEMKEINERNFAQLRQSGQFSDSQLTQILNGQEKALEKMDWGVVLLNSLRELLKDTVKNHPNEKPGIMPIASRKCIASLFFSQE